MSAGGRGLSIHRQSGDAIPVKLGFHDMHLHKWPNPRRLQGGVTASQEDAEDCGPADRKITLALRAAGVNATELDACCRKRGLLPAHVIHARQGDHDANATQFLNLTEQKSLESHHKADQREIRWNQQDLRQQD